MTQAPSVMDSHSGVVGCVALTHEDLLDGLDAPRVVARDRGALLNGVATDCVPVARRGPLVPDHDLTADDPGAPRIPTGWVVPRSTMVAGAQHRIATPR